MPVFGVDDLGQLLPIIVNGSYQDKVDVIFISTSDVEAEVVPEKASEYMNDLFEYAPYDKHINDINVYYVDQALDSEEYDCYIAGAGFFNCNKTEKMWLDFRSRFRADILILLNTHSSHGGQVMFMNINRSGNTFAHEFSHIFANLDDEYIAFGPNQTGQGCNIEKDYEEVRQQCLADQLTSIPASPNTDGFGCAKWCKEMNVDALLAENEKCSKYLTHDECSNSPPPSCVWYYQPHPFLKSNCVINSSEVDIGLSCEQGTGCYYGAGTGQIRFRSSEDSLMRNMNSGLNSVSKDQVETVFNCCYPRSDSSACTTFHNNNANWFKSTNYSKFYHRTMFSCGLELEDLNADQKVDIFDYSGVVAEFGKIIDWHPDTSSFADLDLDNDVDSIDIARSSKSIWSGNW